MKAQTENVIAKTAQFSSSPLLIYYLLYNCNDCKYLLDIHTAKL